jgi:hypothetical protein
LFIAKANRRLVGFLLKKLRRLTVKSENTAESICLEFQSLVLDFDDKTTLPSIIQQFISPRNDLDPEIIGKAMEGFSLNPVERISKFRGARKVGYFPKIISHDDGTDLWNYVLEKLKLICGQIKWIRDNRGTIVGFKIISI